MGLRACIDGLIYYDRSNYDICSSMELEVAKKPEVGKPSEAELQILGVLWDHGPQTVKDVMQHMPDGRERAYTTVLSLLQGMEKKRLVKHKAVGRVHHFAAAVERESVVSGVLDRLVSHVFGGRASAAMQQLLEGGQVSADEVKAIRDVLGEYERQQREAKGGKE